MTPNSAVNLQETAHLARCSQPPAKTDPLLDHPQGLEVDGRKQVSSSAWHKVLHLSTVYLERELSFFRNDIG